jgi:hypothetical protein
MQAHFPAPPPDANPNMPTLRDRLQTALDSLKEEKTQNEANGIVSVAKTIVLTPGAHAILSERSSFAGKGSVVLRGLGKNRSCRISMLPGAFLDVSEFADVNFENLTIDRNGDVEEREGTENKVNP